MNKSKSLKVIAVIPARYGSTRLPAKPLQDIAGKPMIQHVYEKGIAAHGVSDVIVATDHQEIAQTVTAFGGKAVLTSPHHQTGTDRIAEAVQHIDADVIINIQGDEPLINPLLISRCIAPFETNLEEVMVTFKHALHSEVDINNHNFVKVITDINDYALYFSRSVIPFPRNTPELPIYKHIGVYAYRKEFLFQLTKLKQTPLEKTESLEQLRVLENGYRIKVLLADEAPIGVDTPEDLERIRKIMENK